MSTRVSPLERVRADIDDLFASERELGEVHTWHLDDLQVNDGGAP